MKLTIRSTGPTIYDTAVELDGVDVTQGLVELRLAINDKKLNVATITILPDAIEVDAAMLSKLQVVLERTRNNSPTDSAVDIRQAAAALVDYDGTGEDENGAVWYGLLDDLQAALDVTVQA